MKISSRPKNDAQIGGREGEFHAVQSRGSLEDVGASGFEIARKEQGDNHRLGDVEAKVGVKRILGEDRKKLGEDGRGAGSDGSIVRKGADHTLIAKAQSEDA